MIRQLLLLIEDDQEVRQVLREALETRFEILEAGSGQEGLEILSTQTPQAILLDFTMPGMSGAEAARRIRALPAHSSTPILFVSGLDRTRERTEAFQSGADDFIAKPFHEEELIARIEAKLARVGIPSAVQSPDATLIEVGQLQLNLANLEVRVAGQTVPMSVLEFQLLKAFADSPDRVLSRSELIKNVWKGKDVSERTIDTHIAGIRKRLPEFDYALTTIYGAGYLLKKKT